MLVHPVASQARRYQTFEPCFRRLDLVRFLPEASPGGSWLNMAEPIQRELKRDALARQHPTSPAEIRSCYGKIDGVRERWIVEHIRALEPGGADYIDNLGPAHKVCATEKTRKDHRRTARAKRPKVRHIGANTCKRPLPFGKGSRWKRTLSGKIVPR